MILWILAAAAVVVVGSLVIGGKKNGAVTPPEETPPEETPPEPPPEEQPEVYTCPYCGAEFKSEILLSLHIAMNHKGEELPEPPPPVAVSFSVNVVNKPSYIEWESITWESHGGESFSPYQIGGHVTPPHDTEGPSTFPIVTVTFPVTFEVKATDTSGGFRIWYHDYSNPSTCGPYSSDFWVSPGSISVAEGSAVTIDWATKTLTVK